MIWSKLHPNLLEASCKEAIHPWTDRCLLAAANTWFNAVIGSAGFFGLLYSVQYVATLIKKKKKPQLKDFLRMHIRSTLFGASLSGGSFFSHCILRKLFGRYYTSTVVFIPAFIGGFSIYLEGQKVRQLFFNSFANCSIDVCLRRLERSKILKWSPNVQTILFMGLSSLLSFLLNWTDFDSNYFWFFIPPKVKKEENEKRAGVCFHEGNCLSHISNLLIMYSATGLALQFLNLVFTNFKNPKSILSSMVRAKTFKLSAFLGGYVVIYQAIRCFLYHKQKKYSLIHDIVAGFLAGATFRFQPTTPIFNSALIAISQILTEVGCKEKILPDFPYLETLFSLFCGFLFHCRILGKECPQLMIYTMTGVTNGLSDRIAYRFNKYFT